MEEGHVLAKHRRWTGGAEVFFDGAEIAAENRNFLLHFRSFFYSNQRDNLREGGALPFLDGNDVLGKHSEAS